MMLGGARSAPPMPPPTLNRKLAAPRACGALSGEVGGPGCSQFRAVGLSRAPCIHATDLRLIWLTCPRKLGSSNSLFCKIPMDFSMFALPHQLARERRKGCLPPPRGAFLTGEMTDGRMLPRTRAEKRQQPLATASSAQPKDTNATPRAICVGSGIEVLGLFVCVLVSSFMRFCFIGSELVIFRSIIPSWSGRNGDQKAQTMMGKHRVLT